MATHFPNLPGVQINVTRTPVSNTTVIEADSGLEQVSGWFPALRWKYEVQFEFVRVPEGEMAELLQFIDDHQGSLRNFYFTDPYDGVDRLVRFDQSEFDFTQFIVGAWSTARIAMITVT